LFGASVRRGRHERSDGGHVEIGEFGLDEVSKGDGGVGIFGLEMGDEFGGNFAAGGAFEHGTGLQMEDFHGLLLSDKRR